MSDFSLEELKLAFGYHFVRLVLESDLEITVSEQRFIEQVFPRCDMDSLGLMTEGGEFTPRMGEALAEARIKLPHAIDLVEKLQFLTTLFKAVMADGTFDREEFEVLEIAATMLGVSTADLDAHLDGMDDVGSIDLPEPE